jgi:hypothetical protein
MADFGSGVATPVPGVFRDCRPTSMRTPGTGVATTPEL